jgi:hypothetical protein
MQATQNTTGKNGGGSFSPGEFDAILQRFDTGTADALREAMADGFRFCDRVGLPFHEVARLTYGQDGESFRKQCLELTIREKQKDEQIGKFSAALAGLRSTCGQLKEQNAMLTQGAKFCRNCETWRRVVAGIVGLLAAGFWCRFAWALPLRRWAFLSIAGLLAFGPVGGVWVRWRWFLFARKIKFRSWRDNEIARPVIQRWKEL